MKKNYDRVETEVLRFGEADADILSTSGDVELCGHGENETEEDIL